MFRLVLISAFFFMAQQCFTATLDSSVLERVKKATVFIKSNIGQGTGFLVKTIGDTGFIATNAHVVGYNKKVKILFNSGQGNEFFTDGKVIALDFRFDLAIIEVSSSKLPIPISIPSKANLKTSETYYMAGFPFGDKLTFGIDNNPRLAMTKASYKKKIQDDFGQNRRIVLQGDGNPGNSGGPIINSKGELAGIVVEAFYEPNKKLTLGLPISMLKNVLKGNIRNFKIDTSRSKDFLSLNVSTVVNDPLNNIDEVSVLLVPLNTSVKSLDADKILPLSKEESNYKKMKATGETFRGKYSIKDLRNDVVYKIQFMIKHKNGEKTYSLPEKILASFTEKNSFLSLKPKQKIFSLFDKTLIIQGCKAKELFGLYVALFGADKKSLFLLQGEEGMLYKLSLDSLKVERMLALNCRAENFVESEDKLLVALYYPPERKQGTLILDKESLRPTGWLPCRDHFYLIASSNFKYAYAIKDHGHKISIINPVDNFESNDISLSSLNIPFPMKNPVISPDSKFIYYLTNDAVYKLRILHNKLLFAGKVTEPLDTVKEYPAFFNSSALWPSSNHKNAYENNKNLLKAISLDLLSFDKKNKQIYYSGRIYSDDGVLIKDFIKTTTPIKTKLSPNRRFLFLGKISSVFIVDINPTPENIKREM